MRSTTHPRTNTTTTHRSQRREGDSRVPKQMDPANWSLRIDDIKAQSLTPRLRIVIWQSLIHGSGGQGIDMRNYPDATSMGLIQLLQSCRKDYITSSKIPLHSAFVNDFPRSVLPNVPVALRQYRCGISTHADISLAR